METILAAAAGFIIDVISDTGYLGVVLLMAVESANIPLPSEIIMPFSGYLASIGRFNLFLLGLAGAVGNVLGSLLSYWIGAKGGRPFIERYGRYVLLSHRDLDRADRFFARFGEASMFLTRLLPVVRTFISFPAGVARMRLGKFVAYSFAGSFLWSLFLAWIGATLGERWETIRSAFRGLDVLIGIAILVLGVWYVWRHVRDVRRTPTP